MNIMTLNSASWLSTCTIGLPAECSLLTPWGGVMWVGASSRELSCIPATYKLLTQANKFTTYFKIDTEVYIQYGLRPLVSQVPFQALTVEDDPWSYKVEKRAPCAKADLTTIQSTSNKAPSPHRCDRYMWGAKDNAGAENEGQHEHRRYVASFVNKYLLIICLCFRSLFSQGQKQSSCEQKG